MPSADSVLSRVLRNFRCAFVVLVASSGLVSTASFADLAVGDAAPEFSLRGSDGKTYSLASILASGKDGAVLAWFPKAFTPG